MNRGSTSSHFDVLRIVNAFASTRGHRISSRTERNACVGSESCRRMENVMNLNSNDAGHCSLAFDDILAGSRFNDTDRRGESQTICKQVSDHAGRTFPHFPESGRHGLAGGRFHHGQ